MAIGGIGAARAASKSHGRMASADTIYQDAAGRLALYGVAFYGHHGTPRERRRLRLAWREAQAIAAINGANRPTFSADPSRYAPTTVDMSDVIRAADRAGSHFFDADTLRFFHSRIAATGYRGADGRTYFVTSERDRSYPYAAWDGARLYTVRAIAADDPADIDIVGEFGQYGSRSGADRAARKAAGLPR